MLLMKTKILSLICILPMFFYCCSSANNTPDTPENNEGPGQEPEVVLAPEIHNGDRVLATNENVEKFLTEVQYPDHDYSFTKILDYKGGFNGHLEEGEVVKSDKPKEYTIRWKADVAAGNLTFKLADATWSNEITVDKGDTCVTVTNLVPNDHYTYSVTAANGKVMTQGEFDTYGHLHQVFFKSNVRNGRDLGGWKTYDGKMVKYRMVYRGGRMEPSKLSTKGKKEVLAEGIRAQLDLRGEDDVLSKPAIDALDFCAPVIKTGGDAMLTTYKDKTKQCFEFVVKCLRENKPVYFHCSLGRDRTGTFAMLLLGVLNVVEGDISKEYELTYFAPRGYSIAESEDYTTFQNTRTKWAYKPAAEYIWDNFVGEGESFATGVEKYLLSLGITQQDIDDFRSMMLVDAPKE